MERKCGIRKPRLASWVLLVLRISLQFTRTLIYSFTQKTWVQGFTIGPVTPQRERKRHSSLSSSTMQGNCSDSRKFFSQIPSTSKILPVTSVHSSPCCELYTVKEWILWYVSYISINFLKNLALPLSSYVTWDKLFNLHMPQFPHLYSGDSSSTYLTG